MNCESNWIILTDLGLFLRTLAPPIVGVLLGGYVFNKFFVRRANMAACIDTICKRAETLSNECSLYWPGSYKADKAIELKTLEAKIKGLILQVSDECRFLINEYGISNTEIASYIIELNDLCTGGDFESIRRKSDTGRYLKIINCLNKICASVKAHKL